MPAFGENLRREREMRGVTLEEISSATKISLRFLEAIEQEDFAQLPGGIFARSFIRTYARYLGLDEDRVIAEYQLAAQPEADVDLPRLTSRRTGTARPSMRTPLVATLVAIILLAGGYALFRYSRRAAEIPPPPPPSPAAATSQAPAPSQPATTPGTNLPTADVNAQTGNPATTATAPGTTPGANPNPLATVPAAGATVTPPAEQTATAPGARPAEEGGFVLQVAATDRAWVAVKADGKIVMQRVLNPNEVRTVRAHDTFDVTTGNAQGVILTLNGETLKPLGRRGEVKTVHLTHDDLKTPAAPRGPDIPERLVDLIRAGKAPEVILRKGAEGCLPLPVEEKVEILAVLATGPRVELRAKALETLEKWTYREVRQVLASPLAAPDLLRFAAEQLLAQHKDLKEILLWNPSLPAETRSKLEAKPVTEEPPAKEETDPVLEKLATALQQEDTQALDELPAEVETPPEVTKHDEDLTKEDRETLIQKVNRMSAVEKIKAALTGNMETRMLLVRDSNKLVARAVLQSPKLSDSEIEAYASAKNVSEEVLRLIATNRKFMKTYIVTRALINNPRAPIDVTLQLIPRLNNRDLKGLGLNRNVPDVIRSMAIKLIKQKEEASKPKLPKMH
jgi:cytoskeleton protein RodZ